MEAFKEKDRERESLLQKKMKEYGELEKQMKKALADLEKREKQLNVNEQEVNLDGLFWSLMMFYYSAVDRFNGFKWIWSENMITNM